MSKSFEAWWDTGAAGAAVGKGGIRASTELAWNAALDAAIAALPDNWCDSLLSGEKGIHIPANCPDVEKLIARISERITALRERADEPHHS